MKINETTIGKPMLFDGPKPLTIIGKQFIFLILDHSPKQWKNYAKGDLTSHVFGSKMVIQGSTYPLILDVLVWCQKMMICWCPPAGLKIRKFGSILVSGRVCREIQTTFGQRGPQGGTLFAHEKLREKIQRKKRDDGKRALSALDVDSSTSVPLGVGSGGGDETAQ